MRFSSTELSDISFGTWHNLDDEVVFTGISYSIRYAKKGDLFIVRTKSDYHEIKRSGEQDIDKALDIGVAGFLVSGDIVIPDIPYFSVGNTKYALIDIAKYNVHRCGAKRVLVTGSYGKTGFKVRLAHLLEQQKRVSAIKNSSNQDSGVFLALSKIESNDDVAIIEVSASSRHRTARRADIVSPDVVVITSIGHEHIDRHGSIDNIIKQKTSVVTGMKQGGVCLIAKDQFYNKVHCELLKHNPRINILSFGSDDSCDAFVVEREFVDFGWNAKINIRGKLVSLRIPLIDSFAVDAAVSELLSVDLLGGNVFEAVERYSSIDNYRSSGDFFNVHVQGKTFFLYDQSRRGGIENYQCFFKTLSYIKPNRNGRKLLLTSAFMDYKDGDIRYVKGSMFRESIAKAGLSGIFTVEYFPEHIDVLEDKNIWIEHKSNCEEIFDSFFDYINDDDFVCVKGIFESKLKRFMGYLVKKKHATINPVRN